MSKRTPPPIRRQSILFLFGLALVLRYTEILTAPYSLGRLVLSTNRADSAGSSPSVGASSLLNISAEEQRTLDQFLAEKRNVTMATIRANGSSQLTPVWFNWNGEQFTISITTDRAKYKNLVHDSRMSLCIDDVTGYTYVTAEGKAEIRDTDIWEETGKILTKYRGKEGGADYLEQLKKQPRVLVVLKPSRMEIRGLVKQDK